MNSLRFDRELDVRDLDSPMPVVEARKAICDLTSGQVLKVTATDDCSVKDFQGWTRSEKDLDLIAQATERSNGRTLFIHYVQVK